MDKLQYHKITLHLFYLISKRSSQKDICPGWLDLGFGGIVTVQEIFDVDGSALREAQEEMGLPDLSQIRVPKGLLGEQGIARSWLHNYNFLLTNHSGLLSSFKTLVPKFAFKHKYDRQLKFC